MSENVESTVEVAEEVFAEVTPANEGLTPKIGDFKSMSFGEFTNGLVTAGQFCMAAMVVGSTVNTVGKATIKAAKKGGKFLHKKWEEHKEKKALKATENEAQKQIAQEEVEEATPEEVEEN